MTAHEHERLDAEWLEAVERDDARDDRTDATGTRLFGQADGNPEPSPWRGVKWVPPVRGICPRHVVRVGPVTGICPACHREQLDAARRGSREWERPEADRG